MCVAHGNLRTWFPRLRVTPHHFDFDVGVGVESAVMRVFFGKSFTARNSHGMVKIDIAP